jgi:hypothetical protein
VPQLLIPVFISWLAEAGVTGVVATVIATVAADVITAAAIAGLSAIAQAMFSSTPKPEAMRETTRQALPPRRRGCGTVRLGGPFLHDEAHDGYLYRVVAFLDRPFESVLAYMLSQDQVAVVGGVVQTMKNDAYRNQTVTIETAYGVTGVNAFPDLTTACPTTWPATCSGTGIFMGYMSCRSPDLQGYSVVFPRGKPQLNVIATVGPSYDWRDSSQSLTDASTWKVTSNPIVNLVHELTQYREYDWSQDFAPTLSILTAEANLCDQPIGVLNLLAKIIVDAAQAAHSVVIQSGPTPPLGVNFYLGGQTFVVTAVDPYSSGGMTGNRVSWDSATPGLAAPIALGSVARWEADTAHPVTEPTYACGGAWNCDEQEADTVKRFLESMDGWMGRRGNDGAMVIRCGHYYDPTVIIGADEVISYTWQPYVERGKAINQIIPSFVSPAYDYSQIDTTPMQDDADIGQNGLSSQGFQPDMVQSNGQVRRLAKRRLHKLMAHVESITLKASGIRALGERYIRLQMPGELDDLADIVLEVVGDCEVIASGMAVTLPVAPADPDIDAWDPYTDEGPGPADSAAAVVNALTAPTITSCTTFVDASGSSTGGGSGGSSPTTGVRLKILAAPPADMAARTDLIWFSQWRVSGDSSWVQNRFDNLAAGSVELDTGFVTDTAALNNLDVEAAYETGAGSLSPWSTIVHPSTRLTRRRGAP